MASMVPIRPPSRSSRVRPSHVLTVSMSGIWRPSRPVLPVGCLLVLTRCRVTHDGIRAQGAGFHPPCEWPGPPEEDTGTRGVLVVRPVHDADGAREREPSTSVTFYDGDRRRG